MKTNNIHIVPKTHILIQNLGDGSGPEWVVTTKHHEFTSEDVMGYMGHHMTDIGYPSGWRKSGKPKYRVSVYNNSIVRG